jgi:hypothetical protein
MFGPELLAEANRQKPHIPDKSTDKSAEPNERAKIWGAPATQQVFKPMLLPSGNLRQDVPV